MSNMTTTEGTQKKLVTRMAERFGVDEGKLMTTLKSTAFRVKDGEATNEQLMALMIVADQHKLNPFTKEIYAFPDKQNGIVPVVGVDGWSRIINSHPDFDGMEFRQSEEIVEMPGAKPCPAWIECSMYHKSRSHPTTVREYLDECYRPAFKSKSGYEVTGPWQTHTKRFLRHKTMIQCARIAYGFSGIYDPDEAERIQEAQTVEAEYIRYTEDQRERYMDALEDGDATAFYLLREEVGVDAWCALFNSFPKGEKTKQKNVARELEAQGEQTISEYIKAIEDAAEAEDVSGLAEVMSEMNERETEVVLARVNGTAHDFVNSLKEAA